MPHSLLVFFLPDSTAFLIAENLFFHHAGRILLDDLIEGLKIGYLVLEVLVLFSQFSFFRSSPLTFLGIASSGTMTTSAPEAFMPSVLLRLPA